VRIRSDTDVFGFAGYVTTDTSPPARGQFGQRSFGVVRGPFLTNRSECERHLAEVAALELGNETLHVRVGCVQHRPGEQARGIL